MKKVTILKNTVTNLYCKWFLCMSVSHYTTNHYTTGFLKASITLTISVYVIRCIVVVQLLIRVQLFATLWTAACQASLSFTISQSLLRLMSIESMMPSNHLILCFPLLLLPSVFPSIGVFSNQSALCIRWPKYWSFSSNEFQGWFPLGLTGWKSL